MAYAYRELSDSFWEKLEDLLPKKNREADKKYIRKQGGGRKPAPQRQILVAMLFVLRTGISWNKLPGKVYGAPSTVHRYFKLWEHAGFFQKLWEKGLAEEKEMEGIAWEWTYKKCTEATKGTESENNETAVKQIWRPVIERRGRTRRLMKP